MTWPHCIARGRPPWVVRWRTRASRAASCRLCGGVLVLCERHDAYLCWPCNRWVEDTCGDPACVECVSRPPFPDGCDEAGKHFRRALAS